MPHGPDAYASGRLLTRESGRRGNGPRTVKTVTWRYRLPLDAEHDRGSRLPTLA